MSVDNFPNLLSRFAVMDGCVGWFVVGWFGLVLVGLVWFSLDN